MTIRWYRSSTGGWVSDCARFAILRKPETGRLHLLDREREVGSFPSFDEAEEAAKDVIRLAWQHAEMVGGPVMQPLTKRQREVLDVITASIKEKGYAPSLQEIGDALGMSAIATVHKHITTLTQKGYITRQWNRSRSIELRSADGSCPTCGQAMPKAATL